MTNKTAPVLCTMLFYLFALIPSCKKETRQQQTEDNLKVIFSPGSISIAKIDSAFVTLKKTGAVDSTKKTLWVEGDNLLASVSDLSEANYTARFALFTTEPDASQRKYTFSQAITLPANNAYSVHAPTGKISDAWETWIVQKQKGVTLNVPLNLANPYFEISVDQPKWDYVYTDRIAYQVVNGAQTTVASSKWECGHVGGNICFTQNVIRDAAGYQSFTTTLQNKAWNRGNFMAIVMNSVTGDEVLFLYTFNLE